MATAADAVITAPTDCSDVLSAGDREALSAYEAVIEAGLTAFVQVGLALLAIRDRRLYRETHHSFETYLEERLARSVRSSSIGTGNGFASSARRGRTPARPPDVRAS
jgi:hypothetical protein